MLLLHNEVNIYYILYCFFPNAAAPEKSNVEDNDVHLNHEHGRVVKSLKSVKSSLYFLSIHDALREIAFDRNEICVVQIVIKRSDAGHIL